MHKHASSIENLSAKELFDLANKKLQLEQTEARRAEAQARAAEVARKREQLVQAHEQALAHLDRQLKTLQQQREQLVAAQREELAALDRTLDEAARQAAAAATRPATPMAPVAAAIPAAPMAPAAAAPIDSGSASPKGPADDEFVAAILDAMKGRTDISDSLLREKLRLKGFPVANLGKVLEKMVRDGVVSSKGGGNYAPKRRA